MVYGNSAQVLRLVNATLFEKGGAFKTEFTGRGDCADIVIRTRQTGEPQLILPCYGDRIFGLAADDEMAFAFPFAQAETMVQGLEGTHAGRDPLPHPPLPAVHRRVPGHLPGAGAALEGGRGIGGRPPRASRDPQATRPDSICLFGENRGRARRLAAPRPPPPLLPTGRCERRIGEVEEEPQAGGLQVPDDRAGRVEPGERAVVVGDHQPVVARHHGTCVQ